MKHNNLFIAMYRATIYRQLDKPFTDDVLRYIQRENKLDQLHKHPDSGSLNAHQINHVQHSYLINDYNFEINILRV